MSMAFPLLDQRGQSGVTIIRDATDNSPDDEAPKSHRGDALCRTQPPREVCPTDDSYVPVPVFIAVVLDVLRHAERFLLLVRTFAKTRSHILEADSFRMAHDLHAGQKSLTLAAALLSERVAKHFAVGEFKALIDGIYADEGKGFYDLPSLKFVLFEYEEALRLEAKAAEPKISWDEFRGARKSIEHIFPQEPEQGQWTAFSKFTDDQRRRLLHSLGNLVGVSVAKNASLSRKSFAEKKKGDEKPGFSQGSFSELKIAQKGDWTPAEILERGLELLTFIEKRWETSLGTTEQKVDLLGLGFIGTK